MRSLRSQSEVQSAAAPPPTAAVDKKPPPTAAEGLFVQTLVGKISMAFGMARSGEGVASAAAARTVHELGLALESLGGSRIDAVLVAVER